MDACLTKTDTRPAIVPSRIGVEQWIRWALIATISIGLTWRFIRYFGQFPIWGDEAMLLLNILERDYAGLTQHLRFAQVAPLLFLWIEKTALVVFGAGEWSVHLFPFLAGLLAFVMFWRTCRRAFSPTVAGLAVGVLAVSYYPIRHACEVKPYAFDLCFSVFYLWITLAYFRTCTLRPLTPGPSPPEGRGETRWLAALIVMTPLAVFASYPSVFVAGSVSLVLLPTLRQATWPQRMLYVLFNVVLVGSFFVHYGVVGHQQIDAAEAQRTRDFMRAYWKDAFPPDEPAQTPLWLGRVFTGNMLAYPIGANHGGSTLTFLLVLLGSIALFRAGRFSLLALCGLPFGLNLIAAMLHKYPFGDSARITLHLTPFICILMAYGFAQTLDWIRSPQWRTRGHLAIYVILLSCGIFCVVRDLAKPFKTEHDRDVRQLARDISAQVGVNEPVLLGHTRDEDMVAEFVWYLRTSNLSLRWQSAGLEGDTRSYWLVQCSNVPPSDHVAGAGWQITQTDVRFVPSENQVMPAMYCRWTHLVRE